jgi:hypothetical protein
MLGETGEHRRPDGTPIARLRGIRGRTTWRAVLAACALAAGCTVDVGRLAVVSTRPVSEIPPERPSTLSRSVEGRSCVWIALAVPVERFPDLGAAVDQALAVADSAALWDAQLRYEVIYFPPIGHVCYAVEGRVP